MTRRRSRRELREAVERLERESDAGAVEYDPRELTPEEKDALAGTFDVEPYDDDGADGEGLSLDELEDLAADLM
jgi:hypothetical protein